MPPPAAWLGRVSVPNPYIRAGYEESASYPNSTRMPIYLTSLEDPATTDNVLAFLEPYVPHSLGLIGNIVNSRPELVKAIKVCTSFEVDFNKPFRFQPLSTPTSSIDDAELSSEVPSSPPALFSIIALQPREQAMFFCSADLKSSEPATPEEEAHVQEFFKGVIPIVAAFPPDNEDGPTPEFGFKPVGVKGRGYIIGRVHEKWVPCFDPITIRGSGRMVCLIRPPPLGPPLQEVSPSGTPPATDIAETPNRKSDRWIISKLWPSDIDFIKATSLVPRRKAYLEFRAHASISVHDSHMVDTTSEPNPVAWGMIQADGSFGALRVEPSHRGLGLGDLVLDECIGRAETYHGFSGANATGTGILGWHWADVSPVNVGSVRFFSRQEGWMIGWGEEWPTIDPDADPTTIDWSFRQVRTEESRMGDWGKNPGILLHQKDSNVSH